VRIRHKRGGFINLGVSNYKTPINKRPSTLTKPIVGLPNFLWCVPRSISTAFEKMMGNTGQFNVISEPFIDIYKQGIISPNDFESAQAQFNTFFDSLRHNNQCQPIFVKDMAYHATPFILDRQIKSAKHTFLIRDPSLSIPSLYRMRGDFHENETGFEGQRVLFDKIHRVTGIKPFIINADQLIQTPAQVVKQYFAYIDHRMPSHALTWESGARDNWKGREPWHIDAINSRGFTDNKRSINREKMPPRVEALIKQNMSYYEYMCEQLLQQEQHLK
jgi:hypothetical protein